MSANSTDATEPAPTTDRIIPRRSNPPDIAVTIGPALDICLTLQHRFNAFRRNQTFSLIVTMSS